MPLTDAQIEEYLPMIEGWDCSRDEKVRCIEALYELMESIVDVELGTDTVSMALKERAREE